MADQLLQWDDPTNGESNEIEVLYTDDPGADPDTVLTGGIAMGTEEYTVAEADAPEGRRFAVRGVNTDADPDVNGPISNTEQVPSSPEVSWQSPDDATDGEDYSATASISDVDGDLVAPVAGDATLNGTPADSITDDGNDTYTFTWNAASLPAQGSGYDLIVTAEDDGGRTTQDTTTISVVADATYTMLATDAFDGSGQLDGTKTDNDETWNRRNGWERGAERNGSGAVECFRSSNMNNAFYTVTGSSAADQRVEATMEAWSPSNPLDRSVGLVARYVDADNYYTAWIDPSDGTVELRSQLGGSGTVLDSWSPTPGDPNDLSVDGHSAVLRIECIGPEITVYLDGDEIISVTNGDHASGQAGIQSAWISGGADPTEYVPIRFLDFEAGELT